MRVAIIGGSGFIGTRLIESLIGLPEIHIVNLDKEQSKRFPEITKIVNVLDRESLRKALQRIDVVVLLAAEHRDDVSPVSLYYDVNVQGMRNTLDAMVSNGIHRIVFTSTVAVYGLNKENPNEQQPADPYNHYGKSKWEAEKVLQSWFAAHPDWNINIIRPTVIFGEGNRGNVYNLLTQIASGKFLMIGKGNNQKSMSYVGNITAFINFLIQESTQGYQVFNYVDKPDFTTTDIVAQTSRVLDKQIPSIQIPYWLGMIGGYGFDMLGFLMRKKLTISSVRVKKFCAVTQFDSSKVLNSGFQAPYTLEEGLERMLKAEFGTQEKR